MKFPDPLVRGTLVRRYKRFLADIELADGATITAHVANPGSMIGLTESGAEVWLSPNRNPKAKLDWRWELVRVGGRLVGIFGVCCYRRRRGHRVAPGSGS